MATLATITLETLRCIRESDLGRTGHSEPYIWPALASVASNPLSYEFTPLDPTLSDSRTVIQSGMRAGDTAAIPYPINTLTASFDDSQTGQELLLVVALWEKDDTRLSVMQAGYSAFLNELKAAIGSNLLGLSQADDAERSAIIDGIKKRVYDKVHAAIENALSGPEKAALFFGFLNLDDFMGSDFRRFSDVVPTSFTLSLKGFAGDLDIFGAFTNPTALNPPVEYEIQGNLQVESGTGGSADACQAQIDAVNAAQSASQGLEDQIMGLQLQLQFATPQEKSAIVAAITSIRATQLPLAHTKLDGAKAALERCQRLGANRPTPTHPVVLG
jgi:hypothetical protein